MFECLKKFRMLCKRCSRSCPETWNGGEALIAHLKSSWQTTFQKWWFGPQMQKCLFRGTIILIDSASEGWYENKFSVFQKTISGEETVIFGGKIWIETQKERIGFIFSFSQLFQVTMNVSPLISFLSTTMFATGSGWPEVIENLIFLVLLRQAIRTVSAYTLFQVLARNFVQDIKANAVFWLSQET